MVTNSARCKYLSDKCVVWSKSFDQAFVSDLIFLRFTNYFDDDFNCKRFIKFAWGQNFHESFGLKAYIEEEFLSKWMVKRARKKLSRLAKSSTEMISRAFFILPMRVCVFVNSTIHCRYGHTFVCSIPFNTQAHSIHLMLNGKRAPKKYGKKIAHTQHSNGVHLWKEFHSRGMHRRRWRYGTKCGHVSTITFSLRRKTKPFSDWVYSCTTVQMARDNDSVCVWEW